MQNQSICPVEVDWQSSGSFSDLRQQLIGILLCGCSVLLTSQGMAQTPQILSHELMGRRFSIEVPTDYQQVDVQGPTELAMIFLVSPPREDNTVAFVQISFVDLLAIGKKTAIPTLDQFGTAMISGVERRRKRWNLKTTNMTLGGVPIKRYEWSGVMSQANKEIPMKGVMVAGIESNLAFSLHSQDLEKYAAITLPIGERSMQTFRLYTVDRKPQADQSSSGWIRAGALANNHSLWMK
jgi:hypothetical protein